MCYDVATVHDEFYMLFSDPTVHNNNNITLLLGNVGIFISLRANDRPFQSPKQLSLCSLSCETGTAYTQQLKRSRGPSRGLGALHCARNASGHDLLA